GGFEKQYDVAVDPVKLRAYGIPLSDVVDRVRRSNADVGGGVIEIAGHEQFVRGLGYVRSKEDIEKIPLRTTERGVPVLVRDVASGTSGPAPGRGLAEWNGEGEVVGGIVVMRYGEDVLSVIDAVKARLADVESSLPAGVEIEIAYDRSELI